MLLMLTHILSGCTDPAGGLSAEGQKARDDLASALVQREPGRVAAAARAASAFEGQDPSLDRLLGDAQANVLMRPGPGLALLRANPAPDEEDWKRAVLGAALRSGEPEELNRARVELGMEPLELEHPVYVQSVARARQDPGYDLARLELDLHACQLVDAQARGRKDIDLPVGQKVVEAAFQLGAKRVVIARAPLPADPDPNTGLGPTVCRRAVLVDADTLPDPVPGNGVVLGLEFEEGNFFLNVVVRPEGLWSIATTDQELALRLLDLSLALTPPADVGRGPDEGNQKVAEP